MTAIFPLAHARAKSVGSRETINSRPPSLSPAIGFASLFSKMQASPESPESRALGQAADLLRKWINPDDIAAVLFDNHLLTKDEHDSANASHLIPQQRMREVYSALIKRVGVSPEPFHKFVRILIGVPALKPVAKQLYDLYLKEGGTRQEYAAQFEPTPDG